MNKAQNTKTVRSQLRWGIIGIILLFLLTLTFIFPNQVNGLIKNINDKTNIGLPEIKLKDFKLGLDLQGGVHLVYEADMNKIKPEDRDQALEGVKDVIERRVNGMGVSEPVIQTTVIGDSYRLIVDLPGVKDVHQAIEMIGETPILEFKEINQEPPRDLTPEEQKQLDEYNQDAKKRAQEILNEIKNNSDFEKIAQEKTEDEKSKNNGGYLGYITKDNVELYNWAKDHKEDEISQNLVETYEGYNILKRGKERDGEIEVKASHILICYLGAENCQEPKYTKEEAYQKIQEIYEQANADNFADLAKQYSTDLGTKDKGGDLGWFTRDKMVKEFSDAVFSVDKGQIIGPVETKFGYHVIFKQDERQTKEYELWRILIKTKNPFDILPPQDPWKNTNLSGKQLERAEIVQDNQTGQIQVALNFNKEGAELFKNITERNLNKPVAIFLDGQIISSPTVNSVIPNGRAVITGNFDFKSAKLLAQRLNAGALPVPVDLISQQAIGASLGLESLNKSLKAGLVGVMLIMLFMFVYYRLPGFLSVISLSLYILISLSLFKLIGITLTLAGIAGFILSIGMAVDANVLIFERMKEELGSGKSLKLSIKEGFERAWTSIRDGNVSTLITCVLLNWFGTSFVKGFAFTLAIGILVSMFTAITITRTMLRFIEPWFKKTNGGFLFLGNKK